MLFGGMQTRPNIHVKDMANVYRHFIENPDISSGCYNAGFENLEIIKIANKVKSSTEAEIAITESNDPRSYRQDSSKLLATGFTPRYSVQYAIDEIKDAFNNGQLSEKDSCYTVKWMKTLNLDSEEKK